VNTVLKQQPIASESNEQPQMSPAKFFETMHAYQRTAALKAAIELDLFTAIGDGGETAPGIAERLRAPMRGVRMLCDFLVVMGFLSKSTEGDSGARYGLTPDSAMFLSKKSPAYIGSATVFLGSAFVTDAFKDLTVMVRAGGPPPHERRIDIEDSAWVDFARGMAPMMYPAAEQIGKLLCTHAEIKVLDIAAGHGLYGIAVAQQSPKAKVVALDWPSVLSVARENAERLGVARRHSLLPGNALEVSYGGGFDVVLVANLLHHWDRATIQVFLKKVHAALAPKGRIVVVEFTPNEDRVSPPIPASFVMNMFANTPGGDAYTVSEHLAMLRSAGFSAGEVHALPPTPQTAIIGVKE
jgi:SAM-dependent methyltransferase